MWSQSSELQLSSLKHSKPSFELLPVDISGWVESDEYAANGRDAEEKQSDSEGETDEERDEGEGVKTTGATHSHHYTAAAAGYGCSTTYYCWTTIFLLSK